MPEWRERTTRKGPLLDGARTKLNENVHMQISGCLMSYGLREDPFSLGLEPKTNGNVDLLNFGRLLLELDGRHEQFDKLNQETMSSGKFLSGKKLYTDHPKKVWKRDMIIIYFTKGFHKDTAFDPDKAPNTQTQDCDISNEIDELRERGVTTIIIDVTREFYKDTTQDQTKVLNMQIQDCLVSDEVNEEWALNKQLQNYDVPFFEDLNYYNDDVRADAAAAITIT